MSEGCHIGLIYAPSQPDRKSTSVFGHQNPICLTLPIIISIYILYIRGWQFQSGRTLAPDAENQLAFSAENRLAPDASLLTSTTCTTSTTRTKSTAFSTSTTQKH